MIATKEERWIGLVISFVTLSFLYLVFLLKKGQCKEVLAKVTT